MRYLILILFFIGFDSYSQNAKGITYYKIGTQQKNIFIKVREKLKIPNKKYTDSELHITAEGKKTTIQKITIQHYSDKTEKINYNLFKKYPSIKVLVKQEKSKLILYPFLFNKEDHINDYLSNKQLELEIKDGQLLSLPFIGWEVGALTVPVKIYLRSKADKLKNNFVFDESINFKLSRIKGKEYFYKNKPEDNSKSYQSYWSYSAFTGFSKTEINNSNTTNHIEDEKFNIASLNYGFGIGYSYKKVGLFILIGIDTPLSSEAKSWSFKNQPWVGFGFGLDL